MQEPDLQRNGAVATITLRRPALANKLTRGDLSVLAQHIQTVNESPHTLVLVFKGEGAHFCSGYDIADIGNSQQPGSGFGDMVDAVERCQAVTLACIQGGVFGGATDLALACDFRLGSTAAQMFMPAARLGLHFYASGLQRYVSRLGLDTAKRLFLTAERLAAPDMLRCGFLTHLVEPAELDVRVAELAATLAGMAPLALRGMKKHLNHIAHGQADVQAIAAAVQRTLASQDLQEGAAAWREKRPPRFTGQ